MEIRNLLNEKLAFSEFKFGFELEAYFYDMESMVEDGERFTEDEVKRYLQAKFKKWFPDAGKLISDSSIEADDDELAFEWPSPVMELTPKNIQTCINFLGSLKKMWIATNDSCGFHVHLSFPSMTAQDSAWLVYALAFDTEMRKRINYFKQYKFFNGDYADKQFLDNILASSIAGQHKNIMDYLTNEKYRNLRIHPQGTIEWRGPRNFLADKEQDTIKHFFMLLVSFVRWMAATLDAQTINQNALTRQQFNTLFDNKKNVAKFDKKRSDKRFDPNMNGEMIAKVLNFAPWLKQARFENAFFDLTTDDSGNKIVRLKSGIWHDGVWEDGEMGSLVVWKGGTVKNAQWFGGKWENGTWEDGWWGANGLWKNGVWKNGVWSSGEWKGGTWENGTWESGYWYGGTWKGGKWEEGERRINGYMERTRTPPGSDK